MDFENALLQTSKNLPFQVSLRGAERRGNLVLRGAEIATHPSGVRNDILDPIETRFPEGRNRVSLYLKRVKEGLQTSQGRFANKSAGDYKNIKKFY
jgi:hypothetical protein